MMDRGFPGHVSDAEIERIGQEATRRTAERLSFRVAELEEQLKSARNDGFDMCKADYRKQFAEYDERIAELEAKNKRLVEAAKAINSGKKGGEFLQARRKLRVVVASMEKDDE